MASSLFMGCATIGCCLNKEAKKTETSGPKEQLKQKQNQLSQQNQ